VSNTFNVADLSPFFGLEGPESKPTPFQEGEDDEDIPNDVESPPRDYDSHYSEQESNVYKGPMTRARMRHLQHEVNSLLIDYEHASTKNYLLPNNGALLVLRFEEDAMQV
jgi:hypothetical protein